jgi:hypothetical protein
MAKLQLLSETLIQGTLCLLPFTLSVDRILALPGAGHRDRHSIAAIARAANDAV